MNRTVTPIGILFLAALLIVLPIFLNGIPVGPDLPHHYRFAVAFEEGLQDGSIYPDWNGSANHGFGDVGVRFYPPLAYYLLNAARVVTRDWFYASGVTFLFLFFAGGLAVYLWSLEWFDETASVLGGIVYLLMPYHANQLFNAFLFAEFAAAAVLPFCFLFATKVCRGRNLGHIFLLGLSYAALILTHLPTAIIGSAGLTVYLLFLLWVPTKRNSSALAVAASVCIGLIISSFYWVKLVTESQFVRHSAAEFASQDFDFRRNFLVSYFYVTGDEYISRSLWFGDILLLTTLLAAVPAIFYFLRRGAQKPRIELFGVLALFATAVFFSTPLSSLLWEHLPLLAKIQFPFRWMSLASLAAAVMIAAGARPLFDTFDGKHRPLALIAAGCLLLSVAFTVFQVIRPARFGERAAFETSVAQLPDSESCECWWPAWARKDAFVSTERVTADDRNVAYGVWNSAEKRFTVNDGEPVTARVAIFFYPHWKATVNGTAVETRPSADGSILVDLPNESAEIRLTFVRPNAERIARSLSLSMFALVIAFLVFASGKAILERYLNR